MQSALDIDNCAFVRIWDIDFKDKVVAISLRHFNLVEALQVTSLLHFI